MIANLAPWRICLLVLIDIYCRNLIPYQGQMAVLSFITAHLLPSGSLKGPYGKQYSAASSTTLDEFRMLLSPYRKPDAVLSAWDEFVRRVSSISDLDKWFDFMGAIMKLFTESDDQPDATVLAVPSLFGTSIRQAHLDFKRLHFQDATRHWLGFERFVAGIQQGAQSLADAQFSDDIARMNTVSGGTISSILQSKIPLDNQRTKSQDPIDAEKLLAFQIEQMQRLGNRLPDQMREHFEVAVRRSVRVSNLSNYLGFLDSWYAGDYASSSEELHRYYDYAMLNKDKSQYQYALLNTAILEADFGCREEAIAAMQETITTARENKDMACLNFSLSWLYHFRTIYGQDIRSYVDGALLSSDAKSLAFLKAKAYESKMWNIVSTTMLSEARLYLSQGRRPLEAIERVYESSHLNTRQHLRSVKGAQLLVQSSCFSRLGIASLAKSYTSLVSISLLQDLPIEDSLRALGNTAFSFAVVGKYDEANALLDQIPPNVHRTLKHHQIISAYSGLVALKRSLHRSELDLAELHLASLKSAPHPESDMAFQISFLELDYLERRNDFDRLFPRIEELAERNDLEGRGSASADVYHRMRLMSKKALVFAKFGKPQKGLSLSLRATVAALEAKILAALWESVAALAGVLISIREIGAAKSLVDAVVWQATEVEDPATLALLQHTRSSCALSEVALVKTAEERDNANRDVLAWAQRAFASYGAIEDRVGQRDMAARSAIASKALNDNEGATLYEETLLKLGEELDRSA